MGTSVEGKIGSVGNFSEPLIRCYSYPCEVLLSVSCSVPEALPAGGGALDTNLRAQPSNRLVCGPLLAFTGMPDAVTTFKLQAGEIQKLQLRSGKGPN